VKRKKPKVGQKFYSLNIGNAAGRYRPQELTPVIVTKVGTKYFYCNNDGGTKYTENRYNIEDWRHDNDGYQPTSMLYESEQEWKDEKEANEICAFIHKAFEYRNNRLGISLEDLIKIKTIIEKYEAKE